MTRSLPTLLLLPGLVCDEEIWADQVRHLAPVAHCVVPRYGDCDSIAAMARRVLASAPPAFALAGHSMGGRVALEVLRSAPARVSRLALLDTGYQSLDSGPAGERERQGRQQLLDVARERGMRAMGAEWAPGMVHPSRVGDSALMERILAMIERQTPNWHSAQIRALLARPDASSFLTQIRCPTLVACGRQDAWSPLARHEAMVALIPGGELVVFEHCGHMSPMERPTEVTAALRRWLQS